MSPYFAFQMNSVASCSPSFRFKFKWKTYSLQSFCLKEAQTVFIPIWTWVEYTAQGCWRATQEAWTKLMLSHFLSSRDIWKEKCGGWQLTLSCLSVQLWAMIQHFASGNYLPSTVCWRYGNSKKVPDITLHVCKSIHKQQNVLDTFMYSTNIYWEHLLCDPEYAGQREFNVGCYMEIQHMENYSQRMAWSISAPLCYSLDVPCTAQTFASWGQYVLPVLIESCATQLKYISL